MNTESIKFRDLPVPWGYGKIISAKLHCTVDKVYDVKGGLVEDEEIKIEILKLAAEEIKRRKKIEEEKEKVLSLFDFPIEF